RRQIELLAATALKTQNELMIEALFLEGERMELRARFAADAAKSEAEDLDSGRAISLDAAFDYLDGRVRGRKVRRPRARRWRPSKYRHERSRIWSDCLSSRRSEIREKLGSSS